MKSFATIVLAASILVIPLSGFAQQSSSPITRADVRAELIQLEHTGYSPSTGDNASYPADIQDAEEKANREPAGVVMSSVGGAENRSGSGRRSNRRIDNSCVGPVSFCTPYFGS